MQRLGIFTQIEQEREAQDAQWGGPEHDDKHDVVDWIACIDKQLSRADDLADTDLAGVRERLLKAAALTVAAIESIDRRAAVPVCESDLIYVPGDWLCPKCHFRQHQRTLYAQTGEVGVNRVAPDKCPNDGTPMERLTWRQDAEAANQVALDLSKENRRLRERLDELETRH